MRLYQEVTDRIVAELENDAATVDLWHQASVRGYPTHQWLTFNQAKEKGANVREMALRREFWSIPAAVLRSLG